MRVLEFVFPGPTSLISRSVSRFEKKMAMIGNEGIEVVNANQSHTAIPPHIDQQYFAVHNNLSPERVYYVEKQKKLPCGLGFWACSTLAAIISAVVAGAGVGSGVGARLARCEKYVISEVITKFIIYSHASLSRPEPSPASAETAAPSGAAACPTTSSDDAYNSNDSNGYSPRLPQDIANLTQPAVCAERGGPNEHTSTSGLKYTFYCAKDTSVGDGTSNLVGIVAYTFSNCIDACANMNEFFARTKNGTQCDSLVFGWQISNAWRDLRANCWLKSSKMADKLSFDNAQYIYAEAPE